MQKFANAYRNPVARDKDDRAPEEQLVDLIERDLGVIVSASTLRLFLRANWRAVSKLAHRIHDVG